MINLKRLKLRRLKFLLKNMDIKLCNRHISLKWFIVFNCILFVALFVFIDLYFYKATKQRRNDQSMINSKVIQEQNNYLKKMRSKNKHNNCLVFGIDENKFEPHDEETVVENWTRVESPFEPRFYMYSKRKRHVLFKDSN